MFLRFKKGEEQWTFASKGFLTRLHQQQHVSSAPFQRVKLDREEVEWMVNKHFFKKHVFKASQDKVSNAALPLLIHVLNVCLQSSFFFWNERMTNTNLRVEHCEGNGKRPSCSGLKSQVEERQTNSTHTKRPVSTTVFKYYTFPNNFLFLYCFEVTTTHHHLKAANKDLWTNERTRFSKENVPRVNDNLIIS